MTYKHEPSASMRICSGGLRDNGALNDTVRLSNAAWSPGASSVGVLDFCDLGLAATWLGPGGGPPAGWGLAPATGGPAGPAGRLPATGPLPAGPPGPGSWLSGMDPGSA